MTPAEKLITEHVLATTTGMPAKRRAEFLHALARLSSSDELITRLEALARELEHADRQQTELRLFVRSLPLKSFNGGAQS